MWPSSKTTLQGRRARLHAVSRPARVDDPLHNRTIWEQDQGTASPLLAQLEAEGQLSGMH